MADGITVLIVRGEANAVPLPGSLPVVVGWVGDRSGAPGPKAADLVLSEGDVAEVCATIARSPLAAVSLAVLLRFSFMLDVETALAVESATYSTLQSGPEFATWRAAAAHRLDPSTTTRVRAARHGDNLEITLDRPHRRNAIDAQLRDELVGALELAAVDTLIREIHLRGNGPAFCSGGDLGEFGSRADPATAHVVRLARSPARLVHRLRERTFVHVHGAAFGGGIEIAAFAHRITATEGATFALPEIGLGLIPGAGGTASIPHRIGRQRTALMALTGRVIDATTALQWGLVDEIEVGTAPA